jgi:inosose dehydratase
MMVRERGGKKIGAGRITRRSLLAAVGVTVVAAPAAKYKLGITTNTRGGWEDDTWLAFREAKAAGFDFVETFPHYFRDFLWAKPRELGKRLDAIGVRFVTISNGAPMEMHFEDPSKHDQIVEEHVWLARFVQELGCAHIKCNAGPRKPGGTPDDDLKRMADVYNRIGPRISALGMKFAPHAHMWSQFEQPNEVEFVLNNTDPKHVWFVLDTGHVTLAGMDPVALAKRLGHRVVEYHLKDTKAETRGGAKSRVERNDPIQDPVFFALGTAGGVDFPALRDHLESISWSGWLTCELDSSPMRPPIEGAKINRAYMKKTFGV